MSETNTAITSIDGFGAYVYIQYKDDANIKTFFDAYNAFAQAYLDATNGLELPIYPNLTGALLDWVGTNLYGYPRPVLPFGVDYAKGPLNTFMLNDIMINDYVLEDTASYVPVSDDVYIRCLCWHLYKGDGKQFNVPWLKRRVARFISGPGQPAAGQRFTTFGFDLGLTHDVSVALTAPNQMTIDVSRFGASPLLPIFQAAVSSGALELPFQYSITVTT